MTESNENQQHTLQYNCSKTYITRCKHDKENPFVMVSRQIFRDKTLTISAKGLMGFLLSLPNNWEIHPLQVANEIGVGKEKIYNLLKELILAGYVMREDVRAKGRIVSSAYQVAETPIFKKKQPFPEKQDTAFHDIKKKENLSSLKPSSLKEKKQQQSKDYLAKETESIKPESTAAAFQCLDKIQDESVTPQEKLRITRKFTGQEQVVANAVAWVTRLDFKPRDTLLKALNFALKEKLAPQERNAVEIKKCMAKNRQELAGLEEICSIDKNLVIFKEGKQLDLTIENKDFMQQLSLILKKYYQF